LDADSVWALVLARASATPDGPCAIDDTGAVFTFAEFRNEAERVAAGLFDLGVREGTPVSWQLPNRLEAVVLAAALARLGAVQNPIVPISRRAEVGFMTRQLRSSILVVPEAWRGFDYPAMARDLAADQPGLRVLVAAPSLPRRPAEELPNWRPPSDDPVRWVLYTSGTTSEPKGGAHTDRSVMASARNIARRMHMSARDRNAAVFPFAHVGGIWFLIGDLMCGSASILVERFDDAAIDTLTRHGATLAGSGPPFNDAYLAKRCAEGRAVLPAVRAFPGGGQARPPGMHAELVAAFDGAGIVSGYGSTETGSVCMADMDDPDQVRATTEGRVYDDTEVRLVDATGATVGDGAEAEICVRGPGVIKTYVDPALNAEAFDADGFFRTGDLGWFDTQGNLTISGRLKDIIIRNGENISASEVERHIAGHPTVTDVAVIGVPNSRTGERACAVVVLQDAALSLNLDELREYLLARGMTVQKIPEQLEIRDQLPRNANEKILKRQLQAELAAGT
jgi:acyl-CoA synthetase (AMP-forming)/AMP-acid ligase II